MLSRLFGKKAAKSTKVGSRDKKQQQATARAELEQSQKRIAQLSAAELVELARSGQDKQNRRYAIECLPYGKELRTLAAETTDPILATTAQKVLAGLLDQQSITAQQLANDLPTLEIRAAILARCKDSSPLCALTAELSEEQAIELAQADVPSAARQQALDKVETVNALKQIMAANKGKDKTVYRTAKDRYQAAMQAQALEQERQQEIVALLEALQAHALIAADGLYQARLQHFHRQWESLKTHADAEKAAAINHALQNCEAVLADYKQRDAFQQLTEQSQDCAVEAEIALETNVGDDEWRQAIAATYELIELEPFVPTSEVAMGSDNEWEKLYEKACHWHQAYGVLASHMEALTTAENPGAALSAARQRLKLAEKIQLDAQLISEFSALISEKSAQLKAVRERQEREVQKILGLIRKAKGAANRGQSRVAWGMRQTITEKLTGIEPLPKVIGAALETLDEALEKLQDWQQYAVLPKQRELVEKMRALIDTQELPDALATKIQRLQEEWKVLARGGAGDDELWQQFQEAAQQAYEPCKQFFGEQAEQRENNLSKRKALVVQLEDYYSQQDWESADWKAVVKLLQVAGDEWRRYSPVDRRAGKEVQQAFDQALEKIKQPLDDEYAKNRERKQVLVAAAEKSLELEDNRKAIEEVKALQQRWKNTGIVHPKDDRKLWQQFRKHCDAVFEKQKQANDAFKQGLEENRQQAEALIARLQEQTIDLKAIRPLLDEVQAQFAELGQLPRQQEKAIEKKFQQSVSALEKQLQQARAAEQQQQWRNVLEANEQVLDCLASGGDAEATLAAINAVEVLPKNCRDALTGRVTGSIAATEAGEKVLRLLCIRAEIASDRETPAEDKALRMEYQVKALAQGFGQQLATNKKQLLNDILQEWLLVDGVDLVTHRKLAERFLICFGS